MIKLSRAAKPAFLTEEKVNELTAIFKAEKTSVWNIDEIKAPLLASSAGKCAYCETDLTSESNYMEVEHFEDKSGNPDKVVKWENLLPSCKRCNGSKSTHDVIANPIINPYDENPRIHLAMRLYRMKGKTQKAAVTIDVVGLNHSERLVMGRFSIGEKVSVLIESAIERFDVYKGKRDTRSKNRIVSVIEGLLNECDPKAEFCATTATILTTDPDFKKLVEEMKRENIWTPDLQDYLDVASAHALELI